MRWEEMRRLVEEGYRAFVVLGLTLLDKRKYGYT